MKIKGTLIFLILHLGVQLFAQDTAIPQVFKIRISYYADYKCIHEIQGDQTKSFQETSTGFLWNGEYIVTAYHAVASLCDEQIEVSDHTGKLYQATFIGGETMLDVAVLKLNTALPDRINLASTKGGITAGNEVKVAGYTNANIQPEQVNGLIEDTNVCMPGCFGSHQFSFSINESLPKGYSGSPVILQGALAGMIVSSNRQTGKAYALEGSILKTTVEDIISDQRKKRVFSGAIWMDSNEGVQLVGVLPSANADLKTYASRHLIKINNQRVSTLIEMRTLLENVNADENAVIKYTFASAYGEESIEVPVLIFKNQHSEEIVHHFSKLEILPFTLQSESYPKLVVEEAIRTYNIGYDDVLKVVGLPSINSGIRCSNIWDLGLILKTFAPTDTNVVLFFEDGKTVKMRMPKILVN